MPAIRLARPADLPLLATIEAAAERLFVDFGIELPPSSVTESRWFVDSCADQRLLVAVADPEADLPVGFSLLELVDGAVYIDEIDVHPDHGRRGLGTVLVEASCAWARERGHATITLTTWRDVPWNARFYRKLGFTEIPDAQLGPQLAAIRRDEAARGLEKQFPRCAMRRSV